MRICTFHVQLLFLSFFDGAGFQMPLHAYSGESGAFLSGGLIGYMHGSRDQVNTWRRQILMGDNNGITLSHGIFRSDRRIGSRLQQYAKLFVLF